MQEAVLVFREASLRERCTVPVTISDLKILASEVSGDTGEPSFVVKASGSIDADRGLMHLLRASSQCRRIPAFLTGVLDSQKVILAGRYKIALAQQDADGFSWSFRLSSAPGARVLPGAEVVTD